MKKGLLIGVLIVLGLLSASGAVNLTETPKQEVGYFDDVVTAKGPVVNVLAYGAVGDWNGATGTDDTAAIQAAIDSLPSTGYGSVGGTVYVPAGRYKITSPLVIGAGIHLRGAGRYATDIHNTGTGDAIQITQASGTHEGRGEVAYMTISGTVASRDGLHIGGGSVIPGYWTFRDLYIYSHGRHGIYEDGVVGGDWFSIYSYSNYQDGLYMTGNVGAPGTYSTINCFYGCQFRVNQGYGINIQGGYEGNTFYSCLFESNLWAPGALLATNDTRLIECVFEGNDHWTTSGTTGVAVAGNVTFTDASATFTTLVVGGRIHITGAGPGGVELDTTIATRVSNTEITLTNAPSISVNPATYKYGANVQLKINGYENRVTGAWFNNGKIHLESSSSNNIIQNTKWSGDNPNLYIDSGTPTSNQILFSQTLYPVLPGGGGTAQYWGVGATEGIVTYGLINAAGGIALNGGPNIYHGASTGYVNLFGGTAGGGGGVTVYGESHATYPGTTMFMSNSTERGRTNADGITSVTFVQSGVSAGVTATNPGAQGDNPITKQITQVSTVGTASDAVTAPAALAGREFTVFNDGANTLEIWPSSGDNLGAGVNTAVTLVAGSNATYKAYDTTNWKVAGGGGYDNLTEFMGQTAWRVFYSDGSGDVKELALGSSGYLKTNGASAAPSWDTPAGAGDFLADGSVPMTAPLFINEVAGDSADQAGKGQIWVKNTTPNELWFTDDAGTAVQLGTAGAGDITSVWADTTGDVGALTAEAGDTLDASLTDSTVPWKVNATAAPTVEGQAIWESDADRLRIGDGAATMTVAMTADKLSAFAATSSAELQGVLSDETGTGGMVGANSPTFVDDVTIAADGVKVTGTDGRLTYLGLGNGFDEDLTMDLDTVTNTVTFSSTTGLTDATWNGISSVVRGYSDTPATGPYLNFERDRDGTPTYDLSSGDSLGTLAWYGFETAGHHLGATITALVDGTPGNADMPTRIEIATSPDGSSTPVLRMMIDSAGNVNLGADDNKADMKVHHAGTLTFYDSSDDTSVVLGPVGNGGTILGVTGTINATGLQVGGSAVLTAEVDGSTTNEIEVVDEAFSAANFNGGTTQAVSQDDFYDLWHGIDTDDDGDVDAMDATVWATKQAADADLTSLAGGVNGLVKGAGDGKGYSAASQGTDYYAPSGTDVAVVDGGTGTSTGSITGTTALTFTAGTGGGPDQNVTLAPAGTGAIVGKWNATDPVAVTGGTWYLNQADDTYNVGVIDTYGTGRSVLRLRHAMGSAATKSGVTNGTACGWIDFSGYGATAYHTSVGARINGYATEQYTDAAGGTALSFATRPNGSVAAPTTRLTIGENGLATFDAGLTSTAGTTTLGTVAGAVDAGAATSLEIPNGANPTVDAAGEIAQDTDGANEAGDVSIRAYDGTNTFLVERKLKTFQATIIKPQDLADTTRDCVPFWSNNTGMVFTITEIRAWSDTDNTTVTVEVVTATNFSAPATIDALEIATDGTGVYHTTETTITDATVAHDEILTLDFDDTDDPGWVKVEVTGWFNAAVD